jgi:Icc-related predicted phosphoesterase
VFMKKKTVHCLFQGILSVLILLCGTNAYPEPSSGTSDQSPAVWKFVVFGDTRDATKNTTTGVSKYLPAIARGIAAEKPDFVIHTGDLINGYYTTSNSPVHRNYRKMFQAWQQEAKPIFDYTRRAGIPIYVVRGNHEDGEFFTDQELKQDYLDMFGALMPQNGPADEKGLTYSFTHKRAKIIALDEYRGFEMLTKGKVNQKWLDGELARDKRAFTLVFGHTPAYKVSKGKISDSPPPVLYGHRAARDAFWSSLERNDVAAYFCGHVHFYTHGVKDGIHQLVIGNGGANMVDFDPKEVDPSLTLVFPRQYIKSADMKAGYVLVVADEVSSTMTVVQKLWNEQSEQWEQGETFVMR